MIDDTKLSPEGHFLYRIVTIQDDGSRKFHRGTLLLGQCIDGVWVRLPTDGHPAEAIAQAEELWTPEVIAAARAKAEAEYTPPAPITSVSPRQARMALASMGILEDVEAAVTAAGPMMRIQWDYAFEVRIDDPNLITLAQFLGIEAQLPALFELAATL